MKPIKNVLIVGGGTAGWLTAAFMARTIGTSGPDGVNITLVESPEIGIIGVGEATFPSIRGTLAALGIDEATFIYECNATFKQGIQFVNWVRPKGAPGADHYFHPFNLPSQRSGAPELLPYWLQGAAAPGVAFAAAATIQKHVVDAFHGPRHLDEKDYAGALNYAYHFDTARFAGLLSKHAQGLGVRHVSANVERVELADDGSIGAVVTKEAGTLTADLYIDCSGFRSLLIGQALGEPFHSIRDTLFVDRALALQIPYPKADTPINSYTLATAHEAGWTWDIGLQRRRGVGYAYSSRHTSDERAAEILHGYLGPDGDAIEPKMLKLNTGYRDAHWVKNCVAVGLAGGFVEPLESSGICQIETAAYLVSYLFPRDGDMAPVAKSYNKLMKARYERIVDFIKMHYCLTQRTDSAFWTDNTDPATIPDGLRDKLAMWRCRPPHRLDFVVDLEMYPPTSWQYVLYGMEFKTTMSANAVATSRFEEARREFELVAQMGPRAVADLPTHRALVEALCARHLSRLAKAA